MLTRTRLPQLQDDRLDEISLSAPGRGHRRSRWLTEVGVVASGWSVGLVVGWWTALQVYRALIPAPADPQAATPVWATVASYGVAAVLLAMIAGLGFRTRLGLLLSVFVGGLVLLDVVMCPLSGHHQGVGAWWYLGMAGFTGLIGASLVALRRSRPAAPVPTA